MTDGQTDGRRRLQYPHGFLKKRGDNHNQDILIEMLACVLCAHAHILSCKHFYKCAIVSYTYMYMRAATKASDCS